MNVQGHLVEERRGRVLMPYWHGIFSIGGVSGSLCGWFCAGVGVPLSWQLPMVSAVLMVVMGLATTHYLQDRTRDSSVQAKPSKEQVGHGSQNHLANGSITYRERRRNLEPVIILLGIVIFATALGEGTANDWLALLLVDTRRAPAALGALTYGGFNLTMAIGRFAGGAVIERYGRVPVLRSAGTLACVSVMALCLVNSTVVALLGAFGWGLGLSVVFPTVISAAGEVPGRGAAAIAQVATIGYAGFLIGAPLIGLLAHLMPLDRALLAVAGIVPLIAILAPAAKERSLYPAE